MKEIPKWVKGADMKVRKYIIAVIAAILVMNTISFAATNNSSVSVKADLKEYKPSDGVVTKYNSFNHADLSNITGASRQFGIAFSVYVKQVEDSKYVSKSATVSNEYTTKVSMLYKESTDEITKYLKNKEYKLYAILTGYPRFSTATIQGTLVP